MSYTAICGALKEERIAADHRLAVQARAEFGDSFEEMFEYRRGGEYFVRIKESAIAKWTSTCCGSSHFPIRLDSRSQSLLPRVPRSRSVLIRFKFAVVIVRPAHLPIVYCKRYFMPL